MKTQKQIIEKINAIYVKYAKAETRAKKINELGEKINWNLEKSEVGCSASVNDFGVHAFIFSNETGNTIEQIQPQF